MKTNLITLGHVQGGFLVLNFEIFKNNQVFNFRKRF